jgi:hypothetical protein
MENKISDSLNYLEIIKKSFQMTWQNRYLWWLGFFMIFSGAGMSSFNFSQEKDNPQNAEKVLNLISSNLTWIIPAIIFLTLLIVFLFVLGTFARAGVILSAEKIEKKENFCFKDALKEGKKYFWKFFLLSIALCIVFGIITAIMFVPVATLFAAKSYLIGILLAILASLILIPLFVIFSFIKIFGQIYLVFGNLKLKDSIENAYHLFLKNIKASIVMALIFIPLGAMMLFAFLTAFIIFAIIFGLLGLLLFFAFKMIGVFAAIGLGGLALILFILAVGSFYQSFTQIVWVLFFKEIAAPKAGEVLKEIAEEESAIQKTPEPAGGISASEID